MIDLELIGCIIVIATSILQVVNVVRLMKIENELNEMYKRRSNETKKRFFNRRTSRTGNRKIESIRCRTTFQTRTAYQI